MESHYGKKSRAKVPLSNHDLAIRFEDIFQRLLAWEKLDAHENDLSVFFELIATRLLGGLPSRKEQYFDGAIGLTAIVKTLRQIYFHGEMWVGRKRVEWFLRRRRQRTEFIQRIMV